MKNIASKKEYCIICMEEHEVDIVEMVDTELFLNEEVIFSAIYQYCPVSGELIETEDMIRENMEAMKSAYNRKVS